jgi:preprotein translocase subunit SecG
MFTTFIILASISAVLLILAVLIQNPKGGGIAANFSAANQIAGVKKTNEFIEKATWTLAIAMFVLALGSRFVYTQSSTISEPAPAAGVTAPPVSEAAPAGVETATEGQDAALPE